MTTYVALIRGINVGGHKKIKMAELRDCCESLGLDEVSTYIQSGNVVFESDADRDTLRERLVKGIDEAFGFEVAVMLRSAEDLRAIHEANPFRAETAEAPNKMYVLFLSEPVTQAAVDAALAGYEGPESTRVHGSEIYIWFPDGMGRSKFNVGALEKKLGVDGTARNWNTTAKLAALAAGE